MVTIGYRLRLSTVKPFRLVMYEGFSPFVTAPGVLQLSKPERLDSKQPRAQPVVIGEMQITDQSNKPERLGSR